MEPITYALHRWVMHGFGLTLHLSHHRNAARTKPTRLELNDLYPVIFALVVVGLLAIGFNAPQAGILVPIGIGATA
jgi:beta-carotene 3-hydroxylase